jgi:hypothetical protein
MVILGGWVFLMNEVPLHASDGNTTRWSSRCSLPRMSEGRVTKFAPQKTLTLVTRGKLTFDERVVPHRVGVFSGTGVPRS